MTSDELPLRLEGLDMDSVYENLVRQIAGETLESSQETTLKEAYELSERKVALEKKIALLKTKIRREKQLNVQMSLNAELKGLKKEMEGL